MCVARAIACRSATQRDVAPGTADAGASVHHNGTATRAVIVRVQRDACTARCSRDRATRVQNNVVVGTQRQCRPGYCGNAGRVLQTARHIDGCRAGGVDGAQIIEILAKAQRATQIQYTRATQAQAGHAGRVRARQRQATTRNIQRSI